MRAGRKLIDGTDPGHVSYALTQSIDSSTKTAPKAPSKLCGASAKS
jgi:hypothetical protein